ncbi:MAG: GNAT family N-acetyltransferase [Jatrophihabitantaceae bacterium]
MLIRPWVDGDAGAVTALLDTAADPLWAAQGHRLHGPDRDGARRRRTLIATEADRVVGAVTVARNEIHPGRLSCGVEVAAGHRRRGIGRALIQAALATRPDPLPLVGKVRVRDASAMALGRAVGASTYQRCPDPTVDPTDNRLAQWIHAQAAPSDVDVRGLAGEAPDVLARAFADLYLWVHERWSRVGSRAALAQIAAATVAEADLGLSAGGWAEGRLAAVVFAFDDGESIQLVAETLRRDTPDGIALLAATVAATLDRARSRSIGAVSFDGHDDDPHLAPVLASLPIVSADPLLLLEIG